MPPEGDASTVPWGPDLVAEVARTDPDRLAIVVGDDRLTYGELHAEGQRLAAVLQERTAVGDRVLVRYDGMAGLASATLGLACASLVAVLVDPAEPPARVSALAAAVDARVLLTDLPDRPDDLGADVAVVDHDEPAPAGSLDGPPLLGVVRDPEALASISFTSGSTGEAKGIMLPIESRRSNERVLSLLGDPPAAGRRFGLPFNGSAAGIDSSFHAMFLLGTTTYGFDIRRQGLHEIEDWLVETGIDTFAAVPTAFRFLLTLLSPDRVFPDLRLVVSFGEPIDGALVEDLRPRLAPGAEILNVFGLTEARTLAGLVIGPDDEVPEGPVPAGRPLDGIEVEVVGVDGAPLPVGEVGEIVVTSGSCGLGYWGLPELTAEVFAVQPDGRRRVRTGDAGRLSADGLLHAIGRLDHVVKVAGNRVDLTEVEAALQARDGVALAAAVAVPDGAGDLRVRAALVARPGVDLDPVSLRRDLAVDVSPRLVPDAVHVVDDLPTLATGKVDRQRLAARLADEAVRSGSPEGDDEQADASTIESDLLALWREVLERPDVGLDDDFFDRGGDSLRGARLFVEIAEQLGLDRPLSLLVQHPTVRSLAAVLPLDDEVWDTLVPIRVSGDRPPLFVIHGGFGEVLFARPLAHLLGPDQPVYGIRAAALDGFPPREGSIAEVAASYARSIRAVRPEGPYALYGFSLGGTLAFEVAVLLQAEGEEVALLAMGDTRLPGGGAGRETVGDRLRRHAATMREAGLGGAARHAIALAQRQARSEWRRLQRRVRRREQAEVAERLQALTTSYPVPVDLRRDHVLLTYGTMASAHHPRSAFDGRILYLRAERSIADRGWSDLATGGLDLVPIRGGHPQMEHQPGLGDAAVAIAAALERTAASA